MASTLLLFSTHNNLLLSLKIQDKKETSRQLKKHLSRSRLKQITSDYNHPSMMMIRDLTCQTCNKKARWVHLQEQITCHLKNTDESSEKTQNLKTKKSSMQTRSNNLKIKLILKEKTLETWELIKSTLWLKETSLKSSSFSVLKKLERIL